MLRDLIASIFNKKYGDSPTRTDISLSTSDQVTVITSFSSSGFSQYGKAFVESFLKYWPDNFCLWVYAEDFHYDPPSSRIKVLDLHAQIPELMDFKRRHSLSPLANGRVGPKYNYRFDAVRFSNKSFVMCDAATKCSTRYMVWLDGDTRTFLRVPSNFIAQALRSDRFLAYLGRTGYHTETGFLPFDLQHKAATEFFGLLRNIYLTDTIFSLREWHDCEAFDLCRATLAAQGRISTRNLNRYQSTHPFINSIPGLFMDHMKGPQRKAIGSSIIEDFLIPPASRVNFGGRYSQIDTILQVVVPSEIIEVGTWSGWRAVQMSLVGLERSLEVNYKGFDVFENFTADFDAKELNVKPHFSLQEVNRLLSIVSDLYPKFSFELIQGNTNETLKKECGDFVFLDGGHSLSTIRNDYEAVKSSGTILFDDYYSGGINTHDYGCNQVVETLDFRLLPIKDPVQGGGFTQFAMVSENHELSV